MSSKPVGNILLDKDGVGENLVHLGVEEDKAADGLAELGTRFGIPVITSKDYPPQAPLLESNPSIKFLKQYKVVPLSVSDGTLKVAVSDPLDAFPVEALENLTGLAAETVLGREEDILAAIEGYYGEGSMTVGKIVEGMDDRDLEGSLESDDIEHLKDMAQEAPVVNLVNLIMTRAIEKGASDIHIEPFENRLHIRYRVDGVLHRAETLPRGLHPSVASRLKIMAKLNIAERRLPQDGRIKLRAAGKEVDIRISTLPSIYGESLVLRLLDSGGLLSLDSLGFSKDNRRAFEGLVSQPHGMILVTGPTGSGKSTTLYAAFSTIDTDEKKVITIEDPVEYHLDGVTQIHVKPKINLTFANGLRSIVRQDPDIIMVGEIRDAETAEIAIHSALTGHLILSTLHTNDAPGAVTRLMDMGVESYLLSSSLIGVLAQRLVRVICRDCKVESEVDERMLGTLGGGTAGLKAYRGAGCESCDHTGFRGRTGIFELMPMSDELRELVVGRKGSDVLRRKAMGQGMVTLRQDGLEKVRQGVTTLEEVARVTQQES